MILLITNINAQQQWANFTNGDYIYTVQSAGGIVWAGTWYGGLTRIDLATGEHTYYNKANSVLPDNIITSLAVEENGKLWIETYNRGVVLQNCYLFTTSLPVSILLSLKIL